MKFNKDERASLVKAFRAAKKYLSPTRFDKHDMCEYICWALDKAFERDGVTAWERNAAKTLVAKRLGGIPTLKDWMCAKHPELRGEMVHDYVENKGRKMQETRKAWLNAMIEEFSR